MALDYISIIDTLYELFLWNSLCSDNCLGSWAGLLSARLKVCGCNETCLRSRLNAQVLKVWIVIDVRVCCSWWLKRMHTGGPNVWCFFWVKRDNVSATRMYFVLHTPFFIPSQTFQRPFPTALKVALLNYLCPSHYHLLQTKAWECFQWQEQFSLSLS